MKVPLPNFEKRGGVIVAIAQCGVTQDILMVAYANRVAYQKTLETGKAHYFSTSRNELWPKGVESGNYQEVIDVYLDCDGDAVVYVVVQKGQGVACHTEARSCFYRSGIGRPLGIPAPKAGKNEELQEMDVQVHERFVRFATVPPPRDIQSLLWTPGVLQHQLNKRVREWADDSYTCKLISKGVHGCAKKFGEEAAETIIAAMSEGKARVVSEAADVVYHLLVLLMSRDIDFEAVQKELQRREAQSGLAERASRETA